MENILKVLQEPTETMYKGLSQRAQNELSPQELSIWGDGRTVVLSQPVFQLLANLSNISRRGSINLTHNRCRFYMKLYENFYTIT